MTKILLVDEVQLFLELARTFLKRTGCEVFTATTGQEALETARTHRPHVIVTEADLPVLDGIALCGAIKADPELHATPVIFMASPLRYPRCAAAGGDAFVPKPLEREPFLDAIRRFVPLAERASSRVPVALEARYERLGSERPALVRDLGATGVFLSTRERLEPGDTLDLIFSLGEPGAQTIRAQGEVVRTVEEGTLPGGAAGAGVRFNTLSARSRLEISRFLRGKAEDAP